MSKPVLSRTQLIDNYRLKLKEKKDMEKKVDDGK